MLIPGWKGKRRRGPDISPEQVWGRVAERVGGSLGAGSSAKDPVLVLKVEAWTLMVTRQVVGAGESRQVYTRARVLFRAPSEFRLQVLPRNFFHRVAELFGKRDLTLGRKDFDEAFTVRCTSPGRARSLLARSGVVALLLGHPHWSVEVKPESRRRRRRLGQEVSRLVVHRKGLVTDEAELEALVSLGRDLAVELVRLGIASSQGVEVS